MLIIAYLKIVVADVYHSLALICAIDSNIMILVLDKD